MRPEIVSKRKQWTVNLTPYLKLQEKEIKALSITDTYKYLGIQIGPRMKYASLEDRVQKCLHSILRAPLKPCQRLYIIKTHLLPSLVHYLTFEKLALGSLNDADVAIRGSVRRWLRLPKDTMNAFLHASVRFGGLGVLQLRRWIPDVRIRRMTNVLQQAKQDKDTFLMDVLQQNTTIMSEVRKFGKPQLKKEGGAESSGLRRLATVEQLYKTVDGYGYSRMCMPWSLASGWWMVLTGCQPLQCTKVRVAVLHNRLRSARRNPLANTTCDADCDDVESLGPHCSELPQNQ